MTHLLAVTYLGIVQMFPATATTTTLDLIELARRHWRIQQPVAALMLVDEHGQALPTHEADGTTACPILPLVTDADSGDLSRVSYFSPLLLRPKVIR